MCRIRVACFVYFTWGMTCVQGAGRNSLYAWKEPFISIFYCIFLQKLSHPTPVRSLRAGQVHPLLPRMEGSRWVVEAFSQKNITSIELFTTICTPEGVYSAMNNWWRVVWVQTPNPCDKAAAYIRCKLSAHCLEYAFPKHNTIVIEKPISMLWGIHVNRAKHRPGWKLIPCK